MNAPMFIRAVVVGTLTIGWGLHLAAPVVAVGLAALAIWVIVEGSVLL